MNIKDLRKTYEISYEDMIKSIENYINKYTEQFGKKPSEKIIKQFCKLRNFEYPILDKETYINKILSKWDIDSI